MMLRRIFLIFFVLSWGVVLISSSSYFKREQHSARLEFFISPQGLVSSVQREMWLGKSVGILPNDQLIQVNGIPFSRIEIKKFLRSHEPTDRVTLRFKRNDSVIDVKSTLVRYSPNDLLVLFVLPLIISIVFLGFAIALFFGDGRPARNAEAAIVFSCICWLVSLFFVGFLPMMTLGISLEASAWIPIISILIVHLFITYPKYKMTPRLRKHLLMSLYFLGGVMTLLAEKFSSRETLAFGALCCLAGFGSIAHTLLTSKDFWARRRARLLSLVILMSFVVGASVFVASLWGIPRLSFERILGASLIFPSAFAAIFVKDDVFNVERIFRRGAHQLLLLAIAVSLAVLFGWAWSEWELAPNEDWMLWVAIAIAVILFGRPLSHLFEEGIHKVIQTKVKYPDVFGFLEMANSVPSFLESLMRHGDEFLKWHNPVVVFVQDPTMPLSDSNRQIWTWDRGELRRLQEASDVKRYKYDLVRGRRTLGEISFEGSDSLAFDPLTSREWSVVVRDLARALELLVFQDYLMLQQGVLAAGRMQALLAHHMKNPLAIIKVCAGLLQNRRTIDDESEELLRTIQQEVTRVSQAIQSVFDQGVKTERRTHVSWKKLRTQVVDTVSTRFSGVDIKYFGPDDLTLEIEEDGFKQSLINLLVNSFEAGAKTSEIQVSLNAKNISFSILDDGPGLPKNLELFRPFVTTKQNGTGLGLVHVKAFVDRHRGHLRADNVLNKGVLFRMEFSSRLVFSQDGV